MMLDERRAIVFASLTEMTARDVRERRTRPAQDVAGRRPIRYGSLRV
jgi:hypothetical protein